MTKNEFIEKYGEEAYQRHLEQKKQYRKQHREEIKQYNQQHNKRYYQQHKDEIKQHQKQYNQQHKEEKKQYNQLYYQQHKEEMNEQHKQYREQHKEEIKQYNQQHKEEYKQWKRNHKNMFAYCIPEQIEQIENYELAKESNFDGWHIHHRLETHNSDGQRRLVNLSIAELKALDMYYNRPASELVFLTASDHIRLHRTKHVAAKNNI